MDWIESIKHIKEAQRNNRLVIFVGAGVSKNSGIPMWGELIRAIADEIKYNHCAFCKEEANIKCKERYNFTQDEYLKIPEYFYRLCMQNDEQTGDKTYYDFIKKTLHTDVESNCIDDIIFQLLPHHIITTNYDTLLEDSTDVNARLYTTIKEDGDLLSSSNDHYIIKMHGDFSNPANLVLKESDYINYEQTHVLISTYIRSLLIDHTFLFVGYSLNDYNLKLIMGWINYFVEKHGVTKRPYNFLIQHGEANFFESKLYESKNIYVIDTEPILQNYDVKSINLQNPFGQSVYAYLSYVKDERKYLKFVSLEDLLYEGGKLLNVYNKIGENDFLEMIRKVDKHASINNQILIIRDEKIYDSFVELLDINNEKSDFIKKILKKVGLSKITKKELLTYNQYELEVDSLYSEIFQIYINNDYQTLFKKLEENQSLDEMLYYTILLDPESDNIKSYFKQKVIPRNNLVSLLIYKIQEYCSCYGLELLNTTEIYRLFTLIPKSSEYCICTLKKLFSLQDILDDIEVKIQKLEDEYIKSPEHIKIIVSDEFTPIRAIIYNIYMFCLKNYIPFHKVVNLKNLYTMYAQAILCTYHYQKEIDFPTYELNEIDIDIITKYCIPEKIEKSMKKYRVDKLNVSKDVNIVIKFKNFCKSYFLYRDVNNLFSFHAFLLLFYHLDINENDFDDITNLYIEILNDIATQNSISVNFIHKSLSYFMTHFSNRLSTIQANKLLRLLFDDLKKEEKRHYLEFKDQDIYVSEQADILTKASISKELLKIKDNDKFIRGIECFYDCFENDILEEIIYKYLNDFDCIFIFNRIIEKRIIYHDSIQHYFIDKIENDSCRKSKYFTFYSQQYIECCIRLYMNDYPFDLNLLTPYKETSDQLQFILDPETFDYSLVDLTDYFWCMLIYSEKTNKYFKQHRLEILNERLKKELRLNGSQTNKYIVLLTKLFSAKELSDLLSEDENIKNF
ncbi:SIR2 family protein [Absiella sp. AM29-15]|uniref:SIR2 family protein n=1 Tax=Absiella sp. AM29-15 TaxID=2292278 RepID=UPI000E42A041|nr:SIR2 family protein [Absiella sp. AM29-15]RGC51946.1 hypothetical protein DW761_07525 [Absiella sp. AM29-15]